MSLQSHCNVISAVYCLLSMCILRNCLFCLSVFLPRVADTGIASEKEWGINLNKEVKSESGVNEDGSSWYSESGVDLGENGYRCRWTVMGGRSADGSSEWKEAVCHLIILPSIVMLG